MLHTLGPEAGLHLITPTSLIQATAKRQHEGLIC
jgi:hypothetical protein